MDHVDRVIAQWNRERPELDVEPMALIGRIGRISQFLSREMAKTFAEHGLNVATFDLLATLRRSGPPFRLLPGDLIEMSMVTSGTVTNRIDRLVAAGLVERVPNPEDGRSVFIALTAQGREIIDAAVTDHVATQARIVSLLEPEERRALDALLGRYLTAIEAAGEAGRDPAQEE